MVKVKHKENAERAEVIRDLAKFGLQEEEFAIEKPLNVIPTGFEHFDHDVIKIGGIPRGYISQLFGPEYAGKTLFALRVCAMAQRTYPGELVVYIDTEFRFNFEWARMQGLDTTPLHEGGNFVLIQGNIAENMFEKTVQFLNYGKCSIIVLDSIGNLSPAGIVAFDPKNPYKKRPGEFAAIVTDYLGKMIGPIVEHNIAFLSINQLRDKIGVMYGDPTEIPGGRKLKYNINLNMRGRKIEDVEENNEIVGVKVGISVTKNGWASLAKTDDKTHLLFYNVDGIAKSAIAGIYDKAVRHDVIVRKGAWYNLINNEGKSVKQWQGKDPLIDDIIKDEALREQVKEFTEHAIRTTKHNAKIDSEGFRLPTEPQSIE